MGERSSQDLSKSRKSTRILIVDPFSLFQKKTRALFFKGKDKKGRKKVLTNFSLYIIN